MKRFLIIVVIIGLCLGFQVIRAEELNSEKPAVVSELPNQQAANDLNEKNTQNITNAITKQGAVVYTYIPNQLYRIYCQEQRLVDVQLQVGEELVYIGGGDTVRWVVDKEISGNNDFKQWHVYIKPLKAGISTNFVINTDRHVYHLELLATTWYTPVIHWTYPQEEQIAMLRQKEVIEKKENESIKLGNGTLDSLNFNYSISDRNYSWKPVLVFDDGSKTYIQMPSRMSSGEAPALFIKEDKELVLVNYRVKNDYYIVDRLFDEAELRCGKAEIKIKRVEK